MIGLQILALEDSSANDRQRSPRQHPPRTFGVLRSWINRMETERIPAKERLLLKLPLRRQGLTPRVSLSQEYTDNLFFSSANRENDFITKIAPGVHFKHLAKQWTLEVDHEAEARTYVENSNQNRVLSSQAGELFGSLNATATTRLLIFDRFESFQDPTEQIAPVPLAVFARTWFNMLDVSGEHVVSPSTKLYVRYGNTFWSVENPGFVNSFTHDAEFGTQLHVTPRDRLTPSYRFRLFDFAGGRDFHMHSLLVQEEHELSETMLITAAFGLAVTWPNRGQSNPEILARVSVQKSFDWALMELSYVRDITTSGALGFPLRSQTLIGSTNLRLADHLLGHAEVQFLLSDALPTDVDLTTLELTLGLSYSFTTWLMGRIEYNLVTQNSSFLGITSDQTANKLGLALTASF